MKIVILTCVWKRPEITKIFFEQIELLKKYEYEIDCVSVGSEGEESRKLCEPYSHYVEYKNLPLGDKWNAGARYCKDLDFDYLLIMGSDQIVNPKILDVYYENYVRNEEYVGVLDTYVIDLENKIVNYWDGYKRERTGQVIGPGRLIHKSLLEKIDYNLFDSLNRNLDPTLDKKLPDPVKIITKDFGFASIKSEISITPMKNYDGEGVDFNKFLKEYYAENKFLRLFSNS